MRSIQKALIGSALILGTAPFLWAAPPAENILLIYYADASGPCGASTYPQQIEAAFASALGPLASSVQTLQIHSGDTGIAGELAAQYSGATNLNQWCQVYDLRFLDKCNNTVTGINTNPDVVTAADATLYGNYLSVGGSLYLQGEHHDYYVRDSGLLQFVNGVATSPIVSTLCTTTICPDVITGTPVTVNGYSTSYGFNNNFNTLSGNIFGNYVGGIPSGSYGSGLPLVTTPNLAYSGTSGAMVLGWQGGALQGAYGAGKLVASFESNIFTEPTLKNALSDQVLQNIYTLLSGCLRYTVTKTFNPTTLCVGQSGTFTICAQNTGSRAIANYSIADTLPTCLTYTSSSPAQTGSAGNLHWWTIPSLAAGASTCISVTFTASNNTCP